MKSALSFINISTIHRQHRFLLLMRDNNQRDRLVFYYFVRHLRKINMLDMAQSAAWNVSDIVKKLFCSCWV